MESARSGLVLRLYTLHVLSTLAKKSNKHQNDYVKSALATYFPCSFNNSPSLGLAKEDAEAEERRTGQPYLHNLDHQRALTKEHLQRVLSGPHDVASVWEVAAALGGALWEIRSAIGRDVADPAFFAAWASVTWSSKDPAGLSWVRDVSEKLDASSRPTVSSILARRGFAPEAQHAH